MPCEIVEAIDSRHYIPMSLYRMIESETIMEMDPHLWIKDIDMDVSAQIHRDDELILDLTGNLDSGLI